MPGIIGIISQRSADECESLMSSMVATMEHERFYVSGTYSIPEMGVYAGWVALENSMAAGQTFFNEQRDIALIFSGECFVDPQTWTELRHKGHELKENKAEWLVHLYEEEGEQVFENLNGLFSGLLIDQRRKKALLFNDRYGVERIYWHETGDGTYFASEAKALLRVLPELRIFDENGVAQFLTFGCTLETRTLFRGINILPGGSLWSFEDGNCRKRKYCSPETWDSQPILSAESFEAKLQETFKRILPRYFESESKIGISLTAGLDSRMIMACRPETAERPVCYTFSSENRDTLDARLAARVAEQCGLDHQILRVEQDFFSDFASHADRTIYITDGCLGILGAHEIYLNKQARQLAPVRLTGNYGSEVLRGVSTFALLGLSPRLMTPDFGRSVSSSVQELARDHEHPVAFAAFREIPQKRFGILAAGRSQSIFRTPYLDNQIVALAFQAPQSALSSPLPALRIVKDNNPVLANIPTDMGLLGRTQTLTAFFRRPFCKATFKLDYLYNEGLPHWLSRLDPLLRRLDSRSGILGLHKFLHYRSWFQRELAGYVNGILTDAQTRRSPFWNYDFLEHVAREHTAGRKNYLFEINAVLTLEAVERLLFRELPRGPNFNDTPTISAVQSTWTNKDQRSDVITASLPK
jgi:asparagine synthase (glutamine-hydrolysing)